jgi:hypothetical protein
MISHARSGELSAHLIGCALPMTRITIEKALNGKNVACMEKVIDEQYRR